MNIVFRLARPALLTFLYAGAGFIYAGAGIAHAAQDAKSGDQTAAPVATPADSATVPDAAPPEVDPTLPTSMPASSNVPMSPPKWSEFPVPPTNVPTPADIAVRVQAENAEQAILANLAQSIVWDDNHPDAYAAATQTRLDQNKGQYADPLMTPQQINSFAAALRVRVTPPPIAH